MKPSKAFLVLILALVLEASSSMPVSIDCNTIASLVSACSNYVSYGVPEPTLGSPCCNSVVSLYNMAGSTEDRRLACSCILSLITANNQNAVAVTRLPGLCGISLGFTIDPNTDCNSIP